MKMTFKTNIKSDGNNIRLTMPSTLQDKRFEAFYEKGILVVAERGDKGGVKVNYSGSKEHKYHWVRFGRRFVGGKLPKFNTKADVVMENGQFTLKLPEQNNVEKASNKEGRSYTKSSDTMTVALRTLNDYAKQNGYEWEIKDGKASLVKYSRIG